MNYALVVFIFSLMVPGEPATFHAGPFATLEECETFKPAVMADITKHNASGNPVKIHYFAAECVPLKLAPQGKDS